MRIAPQPLVTSLQRIAVPLVKLDIKQLAPTKCRSLLQGLSPQLVVGILKVVNVSSGADVINAVADMKGLERTNLVLNASTPDIVLDKTLVLGPEMHLNTLAFYLAGSNNTQRVTLRCGKAKTGVIITCGPSTLACAHSNFVQRILAPVNLCVRQSCAPCS
jgi:hypothetical protein